MSRFKSIFSVLLVTAISACLSTTALNSKKVFRNGVNMLYGQITREDLFNEFPSWKSKYDDYNPDKNIIGSLPERQKDLKVEIYLGTWCGDSKREVPRFFKITDQSHFIDQKNISIWAVDRSKSLDSGLTEKKNI